MYDGIQRPLEGHDETLRQQHHKSGVEVPSLDREKNGSSFLLQKVGDEVEAGDIIGTVQETAVVEQRIMIPYGIEGTIKEIKRRRFLYR